MKWNTVNNNTNDFVLSYKQWGTSQVIDVVNELSEGNDVCFLKTCLTLLTRRSQKLISAHALAREVFQTNVYWSILTFQVRIDQRFGYETTVGSKRPDNVAPDG